jgi:hypothetical protein
LDFGAEHFSRKLDKVSKKVENKIGTDKLVARFPESLPEI